MGKSADGRADQYALAATAYNLLTGKALFPESNPIAVISHHLTEPPPAPSTVDPKLAPFDAAFARALARTPKTAFPAVGTSHASSRRRPLPAVWVPRQRPLKRRRWRPNRQPNRAVGAIRGRGQP
jgi:hypothetical protein